MSILLARCDDPNRLPDGQHIIHGGQLLGKNPCRWRLQIDRHRARQNFGYAIPFDNTVTHAGQPGGERDWRSRQIQLGNEYGMVS